jgi:hypothetical protein
MIKLAVGRVAIPPAVNVTPGVTTDEVLSVLNLLADTETTPSTPCAFARRAEKEIVCPKLTLS